MGIFLQLENLKQLFRKNWRLITNNDEFFEKIVFLYKLIDYNNLMKKAALLCLNNYYNEREKFEKNIFILIILPQLISPNYINETTKEIIKNISRYIEQSQDNLNINCIIKNEETGYF